MSDQLGFDIRVYGGKDVPKGGPPALELRVGEKIPADIWGDEDEWGDTSSFYKLEVLTPQGKDRIEEILKGKLAADGYPFPDEEEWVVSGMIVEDPEAIEDILLWWTDNFKDAPFGLTWETGEETLRNFSREIALLLTQEQALELGALLEDFRVVAKLKKKYGRVDDSDHIFDSLLEVFWHVMNNIYMDTRPR